MLVTIGGLMASIIFPGSAVSTLAVTATLSAATAIHRSLKNNRRGESNNQSDIDATVVVANGGGVDDDTQPVTLEWSSVTCLLSPKKGEGVSRAILQDASGVAQPGRILAILGPSGSGKTTLLNVLAGRVQASSKVSLHGVVKMNGLPASTRQSAIAYVSQEDLFFSQLTVRETLDIAARMRLPSDTTTEDRRKIVDGLIRKLGLVSSADSRVGDEKERGISGGEKKRLSLGIELISTPKLILCDEPSSGLDAFQAERVMITLRALAMAGHTVVCSIHQPSSSIFSLCDDIVLLAEGRQVYSGPANKAQDHFANIGFPPPKNQFNPAERYLQLISIDYSSDDTIADSYTRIDKLVNNCPTVSSITKTKANTTLDKTSSTTTTSIQNSTQTDGEHQLTTVSQRGKGGGVFRQIGVLLSRAWKQTTRDKKTNISRFMSSFMSALLFGGMYWKLGFAQNTIQDRLGLLQVCAINSAMSSLVKTLNVFPREGVLVNRERVRGTYNVFEYLSSKLFAELPVGAFFPLVFSLTVYPMARLSGGIQKLASFLGIITLESFTAASYGLAVGALVPNTEAALAVGPSTFVLHVVFGGLYITDKSVPGWAVWVPKISIIKHAFEALCINELSGLTFETEKEHDVKTGKQVLERLSWGDSSVTKCCVSQARVLAFNYLLTYTILSLKKPRFEKLQPPMAREVAEVTEETENETTTTTMIPNGEITA